MAKTSSVRIRYYSNPGSRFKPVYSPFVDDDGVLKLDKISEINLYNEIQSHSDSCDINLLISRFMSGETDVFERVKGFYADVSDIPDNYSEILNNQLKAEDFFNHLPVDVKKRFNNSFNEFICSVGDDDFLVRAGFVSPSVDSVDDLTSSAGVDVSEGDTNE